MTLGPAPQRPFQIEDWVAGDQRFGQGKWLGQERPMVSLHCHLGIEGFPHVARWNDFDDYHAPDRCGVI